MLLFISLQKKKKKKTFCGPVSAGARKARLQRGTMHCTESAAAAARFIIDWFRAVLGFKIKKEENCSVDGDGVVVLVKRLMAMVVAVWTKVGVEKTESWLNMKPQRLALRLCPGIVSHTGNDYGQQI